MNGPGLSHDICVIEQPGGESGWINEGFVLWPKENCTCGNKTLRTLEGLSSTFTPNGKREFVQRDQVSSLIVVYFLLILL